MPIASFNKSPIWTHYMLNEVYIRETIKRRKKNGEKKLLSRRWSTNGSVSSGILIHHLTRRLEPLNRRDEKKWKKTTVQYKIIDVFTIGIETNRRRPPPPLTRYVHKSNFILIGPLYIARTNRERDRKTPFSCSKPISINSKRLLNAIDVDPMLVALQKNT